MKNLLTILVLLTTSLHPIYAQHFNEEVRRLHERAVLQNDSLAMFRIQQQITEVDIRTTRNAYLPKISLAGSYTRLNDDITFPENLQTLLMGTQSLLIKEKLGLGFNTPLPPSVPLQPIDAIQRKDIWRTQMSGQWMLFSGFKVNNGIKAYKSQQQIYQALGEKQYGQLWLDVSDVYDKMALLKESNTIIEASENYLVEQSRFVEAAIKNGLATPLERKHVELAMQALQLKKAENKTHYTMLIHKMHQLTGVPEAELQNLKPEIVLVAPSFEKGTSKRPELLALDAGIQAAKYQEKAALADYMPKIAAFGQYEFRERDLSLLDPKWAVGIRLQWNIFDGFTAKNQAKKAHLQRQSLEIQKDAVEDKLQLAYHKIHEDYVLAKETLKWKESAVQLRTETYDLINKQHKNGLAKLTEVLEALTEIEKAKFEQQEAQYKLRRVSLQAADLQGTLWNII